MGNYRRKVVHEDQSQSFFDPNNSNAKQLREQLAFFVLDEVIHWLNEGGDVAVFDATNTTDERRNGILKYINQFKGRVFNVIFLESICEDKKVVESNMLQKIRNSPDYSNMPLDEAFTDLEKRIENYRKVYQTIEDDSLSYIKLINLQSKVICNKITGRLAHKIVAFLMGIHVDKRPIWLTRTGHSLQIGDLNVKLSQQTSNNPQANPLQTYIQLRIDVPDASSKGNTLSEKGQLYAQKLAHFIRCQCINLENQELEEEKKLKDILKTSQAFSDYHTHNLAFNLSSPVIYTSTLPRSLETVKYIEKYESVFTVSALNMIDTGITSSDNLIQIKEAMSKDPFHYRIPGGESYADLIQRLEPLVVDLERLRKPVLVVSHLSTLQALYAYFSDQPVTSAPLLSIPLHTVIELIPNQYGWTERRYNLDAIDLTSLENNTYHQLEGIQLKNSHYVSKIGSE